jgi:nitroreductase
MTTIADERVRAFLELCAERKTSRAFLPDAAIPRAHYDLILEAARHAPSGANSQPWHFIVITDSALKAQIGDYFIAEQRRRAHLKMKFPTPNYTGMKTAPGFIVVAADFRFVEAFPVLHDGSDLDRMYRANAERILLQSVAAATMCAHLAAAALGYGVWWVTAIGQEEAQHAIKPLLGVPEDLSVIDIMLFGLPEKAPYKRWKKSLDEIRSFDRFNPENFMTAEEIAEWIRTKRHKALYRDAANVD